jgi:hypothetical protein
MLSLMDVQCPHCHAQGRIITPPPGSIIVGPCPECTEMVVVFGGRVLPLDKNIMVHGNVDARKEHLLEVLGIFLESRIEQLLTSPMPAAPEGEEAEEPVEAFAPHPHPSPVVEKRRRLAPISTEEYSAFLQKEVHLLDNPQAFRAIFE